MSVGSEAKMFSFEITVDWLGYIFLTVLVCSAFKTNRSHLFKDTQTSLDSELRDWDSV